MTPKQCREARDLLAITPEYLADMADLSDSTVVAFEAGSVVPDCLSDALEVTLLAAGVEFREDGGVRLREGLGSRP
jgi:predicted transcriptional regulator